MRGNGIPNNYLGYKIFLCGIVGYVGRQKASVILIEGLKRLEYRGYDSAGLALLQDDGLTVLKTTGRVDGLAKLAATKKLTGTTGFFPFCCG